MKIPLQEKIAELERRIVRLEEHARGDTGAIYSRITKNGKAIEGKRFGPHWSKMWEEFHLAMKEMFE